MLDRRTQMQRVIRKAFTRPIPVTFLAIGIMLLWFGHAWLYGSLFVLAYVVISISLIFSPKFVKRVVDESWPS